MFTDYTSPFEPLLSLQRALERATREDFFGLATTNRGSQPPISVFRSKDGFVVAAEVPGVRRADIQLEIRDNLLRLSGERRRDYDTKEVSVHRAERTFTTFDRTVRLPHAVDANGAQAEYENGILTVRLPLAEAAKGKKIAVS